MGAKLALTSLAVSSVSSAVVFKPSLAIELDEVEFIEERCESVDNPAKVVGARHSFLVATTYGGDEIRLDYDGTAKATSDYIGWFSHSELFRKARANPGVKVMDVRSIFSKHADSQTYDVMFHNCQHVVRDSYNELTGQNDAMLRNDYLFAFFKAVPDERKAKFVDEDSIREVVLEDVYRPIRNAITGSESLFEAVRKVRKANESPKLRMLFYRLYDLGLIDGPEPDDEEFEKLQAAMDEALSEAGAKYA